MKRVLLCVDFSEVTDAVVEQGKIIARLASAEVRLLHVAAPNPDFVGFEAGPDVVRREVAKSLRDEHKRLEDLAERLRGANVAAACLMVQGATVEAILEQADRFEADLIVLGSHGHSALFNLFAGNVTQGVLRKSRVPVLVVPARKDAASND